MNEKLKIYTGSIILIPFLISSFIIEFDFANKELMGIIYLLSLISTHLIVNKVQDKS